MRACEEHPCGYGYPRDRIQEIVDKASRPPPEYADTQRVRIREGRERVEGLHQAIAFERLYRQKGDQSAAGGSEVHERSGRVLSPVDSSVPDTSAAVSIRPPRPPQSPAEADERAAKTPGDGETLAELGKSVRPDRRPGGGKGSGVRQRRSSMVAFVEVHYPPQSRQSLARAPTALSAPVCRHCLCAG